MDLSCSFRPKNILQRLNAVLISALMTGMLWRIRGDHGFGGKIGMLAVTSCLLLLIAVIYPRKNKMSFEFLALAAVAGAMTAGGWGTVNTQMAGLLTSTAEFTGETVARTVDISPFSGLVTMLLLGFGWLPLFGFFIGQYFSSRRYSFANGIEGIAFFYIVSNIFKFTVAPFIYKLICPTAVTLFEDGLADRGIASTPFSFFLSNLGNAAKAKKIPGGRNYFTCCAIVAAALGAVALILYLRIRFKDKIAARVCCLINLSMAVAITLAGLFMMYQALGEAGRAAVPELVTVYGWSLWEYFTGFVFGALVLLVVMPFRQQQDDTLCFSSAGLAKPLRSLLGALAFALVFCAVPVASLGGRVDETPYLKDAAALTVPTYIISAVIAIIVTLIFSLHNKDRASAPGGLFAAVGDAACPAAVAGYSLIYFFFGGTYIIYSPSSPITGLMIVSFALFCALYAAFIIKNPKGLKNNAF